MSARFNVTRRSLVIASGLLFVGGCATESSRSIQTQQVAAAATPYSGRRAMVSIGKFENRTNFLRGIFSDGVDRLGNQAKTILVSHLQQSSRFTVFDRENMSATSQEARFANTKQEIRGAEFVITGDVTEFGRKEVGDRQFFGVLGRGKEQIAYAKVTLNIVRTVSTEVVYSSQGAGEYALSNREIIGFGGTASYDSTLNGKVLDLAIREAVDKLAQAIDSGAWRPF